MSKDLEKIANELWDISSWLRGFNRQVADEISDLATEVHEHWENLNAMIGGDAE